MLIIAESLIKFHGQCYIMRDLGNNGIICMSIRVQKNMTFYYVPVILKTPRIHSFSTASRKLK